MVRVDGDSADRNVSKFETDIQACVEAQDQDSMKDIFDPDGDDVLTDSEIATGKSPSFLRDEMECLRGDGG